MLSVILSDPFEFLKLHHSEYDAIIFPDFIVQRNFEISLLREGKIDSLPNNIFTLYTFARNLGGSNINLLPRFLERQIAHAALEDVNYFRELHDNEHFITELLKEYWEIKENIPGINIKTTEFFLTFDQKFSNKLERLKSGIVLNNNVEYFYPRMSIMEIIESKIVGSGIKKIIFCCFFYIGPGLKRFIEGYKNILDITFLIEPVDRETAESFIRRIDPQDIRIDDLKLPELISIVSVPDRRREVKFIGNYILDKVHGGNRFSDFIVAFPEADKYQMYIEEIFSDYSIPYFIESRIKLSSLPASSVLINRLREVAYPIELNEFIEHIRKIINDLANEGRGSDFYYGFDRLAGAVDDFRNEMEILSPFIHHRDPLDLFESFLATTSYGRSFDDLNAVQVVDIGNISMRKSRYIIIGGMRDGDYPRPYSGGIIFPEIYAENGVYYRTRDVHEKSEMYRLFVPFSNADHVLITYPYLDMEGKRYLESYFMRKIEKEFKMNIPRVNYPASALIFSDVAFSKRDRGMMLASYSQINENNNDEIYCNEALKNRIAGMVLSPTHITTYNTCPRKFYYRYIKGIEVPAPKFSPLIFGNTVHDILEQFYGKFPDLNILKKGIDNREISLNSEIESIIQKMPIYGDEEMKMHLEAIKRDAVRAIKNDLLLDEQRNVMEREKEFSLDFSGTRIKGRIDRMDKRGNTYILMDYKYSTVSHTRRLFIADEREIEEKDRDLSLPIYILWLEKVYRPQSFVAFYFPLRARTGGKKKWLYLYAKRFTAPTKGWANYYKINIWNDRFREALENKIKRIINGIKECDFKRTDDENICANCEFRLLCRGDVP